MRPLPTLTGLVLLGAPHPVGTSIFDILNDIATSLVYLSGDVLYGFYHPTAAGRQAYCADYPAAQLHPNAQGQCAMLRGPAGAGVLDHAAMTEAALAEVSGAASAEGEASVPASFALGAAYPNPLSQRATLTVEVPAATAVRVVVIDVLGRSVATLLDRPVEAGRYALALDASGLAPGTYVVQATAGGAAATRRLTVVR